jgi:tetratricopeptide (TPR) repeat protein
MSLQHPEFDRFKQAYADTRLDDALHSLNVLIELHPQSMALHWHRANVLEKLERYPEARTAVDEVLRRRADFVPALIKRVELDFDESGDDGDEDDLPDDERERREHEASAREEARAQQHEAQLRAVLDMDGNAVDALRLLSGVLRRHDRDSVAGQQSEVEADGLLDRAIALAPERIDLLEERANGARMRALLPYGQDDDASHADDRHDDDPDLIVTFSGMRYSRRLLERALADFQACYRLRNETRHGLRVAGLLHDLQRFDEALQAYDAVLADMPADDPRRDYIIDMRARSENGGAGERDQMARLLESTLESGGRDRNLGEDAAAQAIMSAAAAVRGGKSVSAALGARISDDPDQMMANNIAMQIINVANEPNPELVAVDTAAFPGYQRKSNARCSAQLLKLGLRHVADAEAQGMTRMLGQRVLLSFFADDSGEMGVACFAMKPKWPGWLGFLLLLFSGKWKVVEMTECVSQFDDGAHISTQYVSPSPFEYAPPVYVEKLPRSASVTELVTRHSGRVAEYRRAHPDAEPLRALDLAGMEQRWIEGQQAKKAYRSAIGYITDTELRGLLGAHYDRFARKVREQIKVLAEDL